MIHNGRHSKVYCLLSCYEGSLIGKSSKFIYKKDELPKVLQPKDGETLRNPGNDTLQDAVLYQGSYLAPFTDELIAGKDKTKDKIEDLKGEVESENPKEDEPEEESESDTEESTIEESKKRGVEIFDDNQEQMDEYVKKIEVIMNELSEDDVNLYLENIKTTNDFPTLNYEWLNFIQLYIPDDDFENLDLNDVQIQKRWVAALQTHLGFAPEDVDGKFGRKTKAALKRYCHDELGMDIVQDDEWDQLMADEFFGGDVEKMEKEKVLVEEAISDVKPKEWESLLIDVDTGIFSDQVINNLLADLFANHLKLKENENRPNTTDKTLQKRWVALFQNYLNTPDLGIKIPISGKWNVVTKKALIKWLNELHKANLGYDEENDKMISREKMIYKEYDQAIDKARKALDIDIKIDNDFFEEKVKTIIEKNGEFDKNSIKAWFNAMKKSGMSEDDMKKLGMTAELKDKYLDFVIKSSKDYFDFIKNLTKEGINETLVYQKMDDIMYASTTTKIIKPDISTWTVSDWWAGMQLAGMSEEEMKAVGMDIEKLDPSKLSSKISKGFLSYMNVLDRAMVDADFPDERFIKIGDKEFRKLFEKVFKKINGQEIEFDQENLKEWARAMNEAEIPKEEIENLGITNELMRGVEKKEAAKEFAQSAIDGFKAREEMYVKNRSHSKNEVYEDYDELKDDPDIWFNNIEQIKAVKPLLEDYKQAYANYQKAKYETKSGRKNAEKAKEDSYKKLKDALDSYYKKLDEVNERIPKEYEDELIDLVSEYDLPDDIDLSRLTRKDSVDSFIDHDQFPALFARLPKRYSGMDFDEAITYAEKIVKKYTKSRNDLPKYTINSEEELRNILTGKDDYDKDKNVEELYRDIGGLNGINDYIQLRNLLDFAEKHGELLERMNVRRIRMYGEVYNMSARELLPNEEKKNKPTKSIPQEAGEFLLEKNLDDMSIPAFEKAIESNPNDVEAHYGLGLALSNTGKLDKAIEEFRTVISLDEKYLNAYNGLGNALNRQKKYQRAAEVFWKALGIDENYYYAYYGLGNALSKLDDKKGAIEAYKKFASSCKKDEKEMADKANAIIKELEEATS